MRVSKTAKLQKNGILIGLFEVENRKDSKTTKLQKNPNTSQNNLFGFQCLWESGKLQNYRKI